jgi:Mn-dependent DtxR family transcriptional regulator
MDSTALILTTICTLIDEGTSPTMSTIAARLGCAPGTVHTLIHGLIDKGYLEQAGPGKTPTLTERGLIHIGRI